MLTHRENIFRFFNGQESEWLPSSLDIKRFLPEFIPDNIARGLINQQRPFSGASFGGKDWFGVEWQYDPVSRGSMEVGHLLDDIEDWEEKLIFPNLDDMDWDSCARENSEFLNTGKIISTTLYTGFFERLISLIGFEDALIALIDEEQQESVHALFARLADFYIDLVRHMKEHFGVEWVELHDDWGTQITTMFSVDTYDEMIKPYIHKVVQGLHSVGVIYEQHSCGKIDTLIPKLIETGADTWKGQSVVDKKGLVDKYGEKFRFAVEIRPDRQLSDVEAVEYVRGVLEQYKGKKVWYSIGRSFTSKQLDMIQELMYK